MLKVELPVSNLFSTMGSSTENRLKLALVFATPVAAWAFNVLRPIDPSMSTSTFAKSLEDEAMAVVAPKAGDGVRSVVVEWFHSEGVRCHGWLVMPQESSAPPPVVIMAPHFGAQKDFGMMR